MIQYPLPLTILIADDHQMITDGLTQILKSEKAIDRILIAKNGEEAIDIALTEAIDIIVLDINMPKLSGVEVTKIVKTKNPGIKIIIVSMLGEAVVVKKLFKLGANAFIHKDAGKTELIKAIDKVMTGEKYVSPEISLNLFNHLSDTEDVIAAKKNLTKREIEIIGHISSGLTNHEIADKLFLSSVTVDTHRKNILAKLGLRNTASLVRYAMENNLL